jgi:anti-anti-sigma regulatory factor
MLRITIHHEDAATRLQVEGKLAGAFAEELKKCWLDADANAPLVPLVVDLSSLTLIDNAGKALLAEMHRQGVKLAATGLMTQAIIEEIANKPSRRTE